MAHGDGVGLDASQDLHDPPVLQPRLIVEEPAELLREAGDGALGVLAGVEPVVVQPAGSGVGCEGDDRVEGEHPFEQGGELLLPAARHEVVPEGAEVAALVGVGDRVALAHDLGDQLTP